MPNLSKALAKSEKGTILDQCRFKLSSDPGRMNSTGPFGTGGSKFITRISGQVQLIRALLSPSWTLEFPPMDKSALPWIHTKALLWCEVSS
ncbi:hypothetical protein TNCV_2392771 [Trichonephila clavipes]|nr:hypothetical protein TNCV_2392771 [Trichonephila clavipes]